MTSTRRAKGVTERQNQILAAIAELTEQNGGNPPSTTAIAAFFGVSRVGIRRQLLSLEDKGLLKDRLRTVRSGHWTVTPAAKRRA